MDIILDYNYESFPAFFDAEPSASTRRRLMVSTFVS